MKLYDAPVSGNCYKARLMLALLGLDYESVPVNLAAGEQRSPEYLAVNPLGKIPGLDDGGYVVRDSQAILVYLARRTDSSGRWLPADAAGLGEVMQWLSFSANEMLHGPAFSRAMIKFKREGDLELAQQRARDALAILEGRLADHEWLARDHASVADVACYPYAGLAWEGEVSLDPYPAVRGWLKRVEALSGYVGMEGLGG